MFGHLDDKLADVEAALMESSEGANEAIAAAIGDLAAEMRDTGSSDDSSLKELNSNMMEMAASVKDLLSNSKMQPNEASSLDGVKQVQSL